jgi:hypothetical protein
VNPKYKEKLPRCIIVIEDKETIFISQGGKKPYYIERNDDKNDG